MFCQRLLYIFCAHRVSASLLFKSRKENASRSGIMTRQMRKYFAKYRKPIAKSQFNVIDMQTAAGYGINIHI